MAPLHQPQVAAAVQHLRMPQPRLPEPPRQITQKMKVVIGQVALDLSADHQTETSLPVPLLINLLVQDRRNLLDLRVNPLPDRALVTPVQSL